MRRLKRQDYQNLAKKWLRNNYKEVKESSRLAVGKSSWLEFGLWVDGVDIIALDLVVRSWLRAFGALFR